MNPINDGTTSAPRSALPRAWQSLLRRDIVLVVLTMTTFTIVVSAVGFWKYAHYRYHGLDLAIFTNVLWNLSHGNGWYSSIQGGSYLGDHVEPILYLFVPFFRLWPDSRLLIILQALALGLTAIPIYLLLSFTGNQSGDDERCSDESEAPARRDDLRAGPWERAIAAGRDASLGTVSDRAGMVPPRAGSEGGRGVSEHAGRANVLERGARPQPRWHYPGIARPARAWSSNAAPLLACLWLLNPLLWNAALFEFHALAFAPVFLLSAAVAFIRRRFWWFLLWVLLALLVREDVALIVVMFGVVAAVRWWRDRFRPQPRWQLAWVTIPFVLGLGWFFLATRIAAAAGGGSYAFLIYYGWLGDSFTSVITGALLHPFRVLRHLLALGNLDMAFGLLLPLLFLPLLRPRWLALAVPPLAQVLLSSAGGSNLIIELHYSLLFLPALALATIDTLHAWRAGEFLRFRAWLDRHLPLPKPFGTAIVVGTVIAASLAIGPFCGIGALVARGTPMDDRVRRVAYDEILARLPSGVPVAASYAALPHVAARGEALSLGYAYLGVAQFARRPYAIPENVRYLVMDQRDAVAYAVQFPTVAWAAPYARDGVERLRDLIVRGGFSVVVERDGVAFLARQDFVQQNLDGLERGTDGARLGARYFQPERNGLRGGLFVDELRDLRVEAR